jgi:hypothetical protein
MFALLLILTIISCSSSSENNSVNNLMSLTKKITYSTQSLYPESNTKQIQYYTNNQVAADTTFNAANQWISRSVITTNGTTKIYQTFDTSNQIIEHREVVYDSQGRIISRRTFVPENLIIVSFVYNADNTVTANSIYTTDLSTHYIATFFTNSDGLIYKEDTFTAANPPVAFETTLLFDNLRPTSLFYSTSSNALTFDYYDQPKPSNILKSVTELNNQVLSGLSLTKMAEVGNFYYKRPDTNSNGTISTYQTDFNANHYIEHYKSTYVNTTGNNNMLTTETFYYYN